MWRRKLCLLAIELTLNGAGGELGEGGIGGGEDGQWALAREGVDKATGSDGGWSSLKKEAMLECAMVDAMVQVASGVASWT